MRYGPSLLALQISRVYETITYKLSNPQTNVDKRERAELMHIITLAQLPRMRAASSVAAMREESERSSLRIASLIQVRQKVRVDARRGGGGRGGKGKGEAEREGEGA
jgi:hypothetical protein